MNRASQLKGTQTHTQGHRPPAPCPAAACPLPSPALQPPGTGRRTRFLFCLHTHAHRMDVCRQQPVDPNPAPPWSSSHPAENPGMSSVPSDLHHNTHTGITHRNHVQRHEFTPGNTGTCRVLGPCFTPGKSRNSCAKLHKSFSLLLLPIAALHRSRIAPASLPQLLTLLITHSCLALPD